MNRKGGPNRKSRDKLKISTKLKGKIKLRKILQSFKIGDKVQLIADGNEYKGRFPLRFYGKIGIVKSKKGRSYLVEMNEGGKKKTFIVLPIHLKKIKVKK
jgi:large subunit ribosomal protein L21e